MKFNPFAKFSSKRNPAISSELSQQSSGTRVNTTQTFEARKRLEADRNHVGSYANSSLANHHARARVQHAPLTQSASPSITQSAPRGRIDIVKPSTNHGSFGRPAGTQPPRHTFQEPKSRIRP